jgi:enolase-phosphatase E1
VSAVRALGVQAIVLDIEGTTTPVDFVYNVLFPYARTHVEGYLKREWNSPACAAAVSLLQQERESDSDTSAAALSGATVEGILAYVHWLMDRDRKSSGLKQLQGLIWRDGYERGELRGVVYADVPPAFERWRDAGVDLYIYSSGSVLAQQLLFGSTGFGDLTRFLKGYFDTGVGPKQSGSSYSAILDRIHARASEVLFVSDIVGELEAARSAGLQTVLCVRENTMNPSAQSHPVIESFAELTVVRADQHANR